MSSPGVPQYDVQTTSFPAPIESAPVGTMQGIGASASAAINSTLGGSLVARGLGAVLTVAAPGGDQEISHDAAVEQMKAQNYDPNVLPSGPITRGSLAAIMNQQSVIARAREVASRSTASSWEKGGAALVGGLADPVFLAAGPMVGKLGAAVAEPLESAVGGGLAARAVGGAVAAGEASASMGVYTQAEKAFGTAPGDRDITTYDTTSSMLQGAVLGGALGTAFHSPVKLEEISKLENSAAVAAKEGIPVSEVKSSKGAGGEFQIMPRTAVAYNIPPAAIFNPAINRQIAARLLDELTKRYPGDPEAVVIAYDAGPKVANKWLLEGRDDGVLPAETRGYVERFRKLRGIGPEAPAGEEAAVGPFRTSPAKIAGEHDLEVAQIEGGARRSVMDRETPPLAPDVMREGMKTAIRQFMSDAPVDVKPTIADALERNDGESSARALAQDDDFKKAIMGAYSEEPQVAREEQVQPRVPVPILGAAETQANPAITEAEKRLSEVREQAAALGKHTTGEDDPEFIAMEEKMKNEDAEADEQSRAFEAAVQCGVLRGFE